MPKERLAAFSDGVFAIIITIMVLELKVPHGDDLEALSKLLPGAVGQHASAILALAHPVRDRLDWREPFHLAPDGDLRCGLADASNCMVHPTEGDH